MVRLYIAYLFICLMSVKYIYRKVITVNTAVRCMTILSVCLFVTLLSSVKLLNMSSYFCHSWQPLYSVFFTNNHRVEILTRCPSVRAIMQMRLLKPISQHSGSKKCAQVTVEQIYDLSKASLPITLSDLYSSNRLLLFVLGNIMA